MKVYSRFLRSSTAPNQFPNTTAPEVAFLGRSNVGKSSLLNALTGEKLARVSNTPGRTQTINFFELRFKKDHDEPDMVFADLPGYGYARVPRAIVGEWPSFIVPYLDKREPLALCVCLVDVSVPVQKSDQQLIAWLQARDRQLCIVGTKSDRLSGNKLTTSLRDLRKELGGEVLPFSSKTGRGRAELWQKIKAATSR